MSEVLVLADLVDGHATKPTFELLTLARRLGEAVAVVFGDGAESAAPELGRYGAGTVVALSDPAYEDYLVAPKAEALAQIAADRDVAAILIGSSVSPFMIANCGGQ